MRTMIQEIRRAYAMRMEKRKEKRKDSVFRQDAVDAVLEQTPRGGQKIIYLTLFCVACLIVWAAVWEVEEVTRGEGKVIPSRNVQAVQSLDGGVVAEILVSEGDVVRKDQPLVRIETVRADSQKGEVAARLVSLKFKLARLDAEVKGSSKLEVPADLAGASAEVAAREQVLFAARRSEAQATVKVLDNQIAQRVQEQREATSRRQSSQEMLSSLEKELATTRPLVKIGAASDMDVVRLEREVLRTRSDRDSAAVAIERTAAAIGEATQRRGELEAQFKSRASTELNEVAAEISRIVESMPAMTDRVVKTVLKAPTDGIVKTLSTKSIGAVLQPGKDVAEIVPLDDSILLEARVAPRDIGNLRVGQNATVRLSAYDYAVYGGLTGRLELISPDTVNDEKGNAFYMVRVRSAKPQQGAATIGGEANPVLPGMTASVDMLTGSRTVLTYLLKPIFRAQQRAFTER